MPGADLEGLDGHAAAEPARADGGSAGRRGGDRLTTLEQIGRAATRRPSSTSRRPLHLRFVEQAAATPEATALVFGSRELSYAALDERSNQLAHQIRACGVGPESRVGVCLERGPELVVALLAVLKAGGAYVPIDPEYPAERVAYMLEHSGAPVLVAQQSLVERLPAAGAELVLVDGDRSEILSQPETPPEDTVADDDALAYVIYTSGSTGAPKGVMVTHGALANFMASMAARPGMDADAVLVAVTTVSFDIAALELFLPLLVGGRVVLASRADTRDPGALVELVEESGANVLQATPTQWRMLLAIGWRPPAGFTVLCGGEQLPSDLGPELVAGGATAWDLYGPTETTIWSSVARLGEGGDAAEWRPVARTQVHVLDETLEPAPTGEPGEVYIGGAGLARGYAERPDLTAERFLPDPHSRMPGARMYRTGDVARRREDGAVEILGRTDHQVKIRGFRIELGEIEVVLRRHAAVVDAAVVAREDVPGQKRLVAYVVPSAGADPALDAEALDACRLTDWQAVFDETYAGAAEDARFDTRGWKSSYTESPISLEEMQDWVERTVERCLETGPRSVLELGCGSGLLTWRLAPHVERYVGVDFSRPAIERLRAELDLASVENVELHERRVDDLGGLSECGFDLVLLNSVVQYFPGEGYLRRVLERALEAVRPGGVLLVGDVRNLALLDAFHASVELERAAPEASAETVRARAAAAAAAESELLVDPTWFMTLASRLPKAAGVEVLPKAGRFENEMTCFRYDVRIRSGAVERVRIDDRLRRQPHDAGAADAVAALALLEEAAPGTPVAELRASLAARERPPSAEAIAEPAADRPLVNEPVRRHAERDRGAALARELRAHLALSLPEYMLPAAFVELPSLPQTPNGKLDRNALPAPETAAAAASEYVEPQGEVERTLAEIWSEVLGLERVGAADDFFELGGDSLLATGVLARVRARLAAQLPLQRMFETRTLSALAALVAASEEDAPEPIEPVDRSAPLELSFAQQRLWFLDQLGEGSLEFLMPYALELRGALDERALASALDEIVARHEVLRTRYVTDEDGAPVQVVEPVAQVPLEPVDLTGRPADEQDAAVAELAAEELRTPFDLERAPLLRARLLRLADDRHVLFLTMHHIASDGWSLGILTEELAALYAARPGADPQPAALPLQYADFAHWQRRSLEGATLDAELGYWRERLAGLAPLELPTDRPRPAVRSARGANLRFSVPAEVVEGLRELALERGATLFMALLAAFEVLLGRYSGQDDVAVGTPAAGRSRVELERLIGFFVNTVVLRSDLSGDPRFDELLERVRDASLADLAHQELPFELLVDELQPERDLARTPLFQVMFALQNVDEGTFALPGLEVSELPLEGETAKFDLTLELTEQPEGELAGRLEYATDLFERSTVERLAGHFCTLLAAIAAAPAARLSELDLLPEDERRQVVEGWNDTDRPLPDRLVHELFEEQAAKTPDAPAVRCGGSVLDYRELDRRANRLAHELRARGVGPETVVALCLERSPELIVAMLGVLKAGGAYVPLDPSYPADRLAFVIEDTQARLVLAQSRTQERVPPGVGDVLSLDEDAEQLERRPSSPLPRAAEPDNPVYVIYTSGSTGKPKGVVVTHRGLVNYLLWTVEACELDQGSGSPAHSPVAFDLVVTAIFPALISGGAVELVSSGEPGALAAALECGGYTLVKITPSHLELLSQLLPAAHAEGTTRRFVVGGEQLLGEALGFWAENAPDTAIINEYGPTEAVVGCCVHEVRAGDVEPGPLPIGLPIRNTVLYVLGPSFEPLPVGVPGELFIGGAGVARGYLNRAALTAERFVPNPFGRTPGERLYRTGDLVRRRADGALEYLARFDDQVKIRGFRIELGEVEAHLSKHPDLEDVTVAAPEVASGGKRLVAYVVARRDAETPTPADLRSFLSERLPAELIPAQFVTLDALPLNSNGKVDRHALPLPTDRPELEHELVAPRTPAEETIAGIYAEVLGVDEIGVHDGFFELGGNSLLAVQVVSRLRRRFPVEVSVATVFQAQTVAELAQAVGARVAASFSATFGLDVAEQPSPPADKPAGAPPVAEEQPIEPVDRSQPLPLSFAQQRLWFLDQLGEGSATEFLMPYALELRGRLDEDALERALSEVVARHEALRTRFESGESGPVQVVEPAAALPLPLVDLTDRAAEEREAALHELVAEEVRTPFRLDRAPMLRAQLVRLEHDRHALLLTMHHVASDAWSLGVLSDELEALYDAFRAGRPSPLEPPQVQYADYAAWQRERLAGETLDAELESWRERLEGLAPLELPADRPRPPVRSGRGETLRFEIPAPEVEPLRRLGGEHGATLFMTLLAAFQALLGRFAGQDDVAVGTPSAGRSRVELEGLIGFFVNTVVLRTGLDGDPSFAELLARTREASLHAFSHDELPFERLVEELQPERDLSRTPLFQVMFVLQNAGGRRFRLTGLEVDELDVEWETSKFDLTLELAETEDGRLAGAIEYSTDLFDESTIERLAGCYRRLLGAVAAAPDEPLSRIDLLAGEERRLLEEWNDTAQPLPDRLLHELFEEQAARTPEAPAVVGRDMELAYGELNRRANRLARELRARGVAPDVPVGLCLERGPEAVVGLLAILKAGGAYVPLDPDHPAERLAFVLEDTGAPVVLAQSSTQARVPEGGHALLVLDEEAESLTAHAEHDLPTATDADGAAYVVYTSGSTGRPKGVVVTHRGIRNRVLWTARRHRLGPSDRVLQKTAFTFDAAAWEFLAPLVSGGAVALAGRDAHRDPAEIVAAAAETGATVLQLVPSMLRLVVEEPALERCEALRLIFSAGEPLAAALCARLRSRLQVEIVNTYGPTECSIDATAWHYRAGHPAGVPIGAPLDNVHVRILDPAGNPTPLGVPGELHIGGEGLARGYLGRPDLTAERFVPDPFASDRGARLYRTGDVARWREDGTIEFLGRLDDQVKIRGVRLEPGEVEAALSDHPNVARAAVAVRSGAAGEPQLVAYVVPAAGEIDADELRSHLLDRLPAPMVPELFVALDRLPLTSSGKIDRKALPEPEAPAEQYVPPRTPAEETIAAIWREVLGAERVGVHDGFFALGGHSLLATQMLSRVRAAFGVEVALREVFAAQTVARLSEVVAQARPEDDGPPLVPAERSEPLPLSFAQERLWFLDRLEPGSSEYLVPVAVRFRGELDVDALERALSELLARHEILRTRYADVDGRPVQAADDATPLELARVDLSELGDDQRERGLEDLVAAEGRKPLDLARGPVLRATLARLAEREHLLLLVVHHVAFDGWSTAVLADELGPLYEAFADGRQPDLPQPELQYADVAVWQRRALSGETLERQLDYWREQLVGLEPLDLPTDRPRPSARDAQGARVPVRIEPELARRLLELGHEHGATPFMTLLAPFALVLARYAGAEDVAIGTPIAGRTRAELESIVGFFVNTLVLRLRTAAAATFLDLLARARETALDAYAHQDVPFERLVDELQPERDLSRNPLFQVMFVLQNTARADFRLQGLEAEEVDVDWGIAKFDLTLQLAEQADGSVSGELEYAAALFDRETAERLAALYARAVEAVVAGPKTALRTLDLLPASERQTLLDEWSGSPAPEPERTVHELFDERAAATPDAVAVAGGDVELTYDELRRRSNQLARELRARGVEAERPVAVCLDRSPDAVVALLGTLKAGGVYVPFDPAHPAERLGLMLEDLGAQVAVTQRAHVERLEEAGLACVTLNDPTATEGSPDDDLEPAADLDQLAYVIYTSGSTGRPKGVTISHRSYAQHCEVIAREYGIEPGDRVVLLSALTFDVAMDQMAATLLAGATVVVADSQFWSPRELPDKLAEHGVTAIEITPAYYREMLDALEPGDERLRNVRLMNVGSDVVTFDDVRRWHDTGLPGRFLCNYGPTEATVTCVLYPTSERDLVERPEATAPIGRPVPGTRAYVLDADLNPAPLGARGELCLGGTRLARGYHGRPDLTADRFVPDPFSREPGARLYRTGDLVRYRADGSIEFLGRLDNQVKVRGFRIELGEIEAVAAEHPHVRAAAVVPRDLAPGDRRLVGYLVAADGRVPQASELREFLRDRLPDYMVPSLWVPLEELPLTPSRKVDRKALPLPEGVRPELAGEYVAPRTPAEETIAAIWRKVLGVERVGVHDDFFELGGHSLLATRVLSRLDDTFSVELPLRRLFEATTVAEVAHAVETEIAAELDQLSDEEIEALLAQEEAR